MLVLTQPQRMSQKKKKKDKTHAKVPAEAKTKRRGGWLQQKRMDHSASMSPRPRLDPAASLRPTDRPTDSCSERTAQSAAGTRADREKGSGHEGTRGRAKTPLQKGRIWRESSEHLPEVKLFVACTCSLTIYIMFISFNC